MRLRRFVARVVLLTLLIVAAVLPVFITKAGAQSSENYWVTVKPTGDSQMYTTVGRNWTLSFEALWSYGSSSGQPVSNATVTMKVSGEKEGALTPLTLNTTTGEFTFNYSSTTADIITFTPSELVTQNKVQYNSTLLGNNGVQAVGLQSEPVAVWWDTFQVSLVNYETGSSGAVSVSVNVTYLLLPQEGLTLPAQDTYSNQIFLPKIASGVRVTIDGVKAQETSVNGVYSADFSTAFPTAYVLVAVSQKGWTTTYTAFSFAQKQNETIWTYAAIVGLVIAVGLVLLYLAFFKKNAGAASFGRRTSFPVIGGVLLLFASILSLYWGALGVEATSHGFNWLILAVAGLGSFAFGVAGSVLSMKKKNEVFVLFAICMPLTVNLILVEYALDLYQLTLPWLFIFGATAVIVISGILVSNSDEQFSKQE